MPYRQFRFYQSEYLWMITKMQVELIWSIQMHYKRMEFVNNKHWSHTPSAWEIEAGGSERVWDQCGLHSDFKISLNYSGRPCTKTKKSWTRLSGSKACLISAGLWVWSLIQKSQKTKTSNNNKKTDHTHTCYTHFFYFSSTMFSANAFFFIHCGWLWEILFHLVRN